MLSKILSRLFPYSSKEFTYCYPNLYFEYLLKDGRGLMWAACTNNTDMVRLLLDTGADPSAATWVCNWILIIANPNLMILDSLLIMAMVSILSIFDIVNKW